MNDEYIPSEGEDRPSENQTDAVEGEGESKLSENQTDAVEGEGESNLSHRQLLYQELDRLVTQICQHPPGLKRSRLLNQLVTKMKNSGLIGKENVPYYEDALQEQWEFFSSNLCESRTGTQYDRTRGNVITWFKYYFKRRLQNWASRVDRENNRRDDREQISEDGTPIDRIENLPDRDRTHILETAQLFTELQAWIDTDPDRVLSKHVRGRPDITCQVILKGLSAGKSFTVLAAELSCSYPTLYAFHRVQCRPHLQRFRENYEF
ncbi:hypothetical protein QUA00_18220 [Microcoleus sp. T2B6]|uniref:hypothetical protein n=1 Tax=Microcoleus sp. T2B6 TaxID=3055424 RepID=UPI002FD12DB4